MPDPRPCVAGVGVVVVTTGEGEGGDIHQAGKAGAGKQHSLGHR